MIYVNHSCDLLMEINVYDVSIHVISVQTPLAMFCSIHHHGITTSRPSKSDNNGHSSIHGIIIMKPYSIGMLIKLFEFQLVLFFRVFDPLLWLIKVVCG